MNKSIHIPRTLGHVLVKYWGDEWSKVTGLLSGRANVNACSGYSPVGHMPDRTNVYRAAVRGSLPGQVAARFGHCPVGLLSGRTIFCRVSVHQAAAYRGCVLGRVPVVLVSSRATVRVPFSQHFNIFESKFN